MHWPQQQVIVICKVIGATQSRPWLWKTPNIHL